MKLESPPPAPPSGDHLPSPPFANLASPQPKKSQRAQMNMHQVRNCRNTARAWNFLQIHNLLLNHRWSINYILNKNSTICIGKCLCPETFLRLLYSQSVCLPGLFLRVQRLEKRNSTNNYNFSSCQISAYKTIRLGNMCVLVCEQYQVLHTSSGTTVRREVLFIMIEINNNSEIELSVFSIVFSVLSI